MVKCAYCRKGRPKYWVGNYGYCNKECYEKHMKESCIEMAEENLKLVKEW